MTLPEDALQRLYEDTGWREDLIDTEADQLLKWAEAKLYQFDAQAQADWVSDPDDLAQKVEAVRRLLTKINKFVGRRMSLSSEEQQTTLDEMAALSGVEFIAAGDLTLRSFSAQSAEGSPNAALLSSLTSWLDTGELPPESAPIMGAQAAETELGDTDEKTVWRSFLDSASDHVGAQRAAPASDTPTEPPPEPPPSAPMPATDMSAFLNFFNTNAESAPESPEESDTDGTTDTSTDQESADEA